MTGPGSAVRLDGVPAANIGVDAFAEERGEHRREEQRRAEQFLRIGANQGMD